MKPARLTFLIMHVSTRCDQACQHCSIWRKNGNPGAELSASQRMAILDEAASLGARGVLFTGGEPLLSPQIERLARHARSLELSVQIATNGLGVGRASEWLAEVVDEIYVSIEGPAAIHDGLRGAGMFARLRSSLDRMREFPRRPRMIGRSVVSERTAPFVIETVEGARAIGLDAISFLPVDFTSSAFGGDPHNRIAFRTAADAAAIFRSAIRVLEERGEVGEFIVEDAGKLIAMVARSPAGSAPRCNAPEWSSVIEADGSLRPCFFQPVVARAGDAPLGAIRRSGSYVAALGKFGDADETCAKCVCPKHVSSGVSGALAKVARGLRRSLRRGPSVRATAS